LVHSFSFIVHCWLCLAMNTERATEPSRLHSN
jgi:hypothetical protein